jgi:hypothetical protein
MFSLNQKTLKNEVVQLKESRKDVKIICGHQGWTVEDQPDSSLPVCRKGGEYTTFVLQGVSVLADRLLLAAKVNFLLNWATIF